MGILPGPRRAVSAPYPGAGRDACASATCPKSKRSKNCSRSISPHGKNRAPRANALERRNRKGGAGMSQNVKPRLPEFLGIGPPRTGTTWLHQRARGPRRSALRRQRDALLHHLLRQGLRLVRAPFSLRDRRAKSRRGLSLFLRHRDARSHQERSCRTASSSSRCAIRSIACTRCTSRCVIPPRRVAEVSSRP